MVLIMNLFAGHQWKSSHRGQTYGHEERRGDSETYRESNMETYMTICKIDSQRKFAVCLRELKQGLCINVEGWEGDGRKFQKEEDICIPMSFPCDSASKEPSCSVGDLGLTSGLEDHLEKGKSTHSSILAWRIPVAKSQTRLSNFHTSICIPMADSCQCLTENNTSR